MASNSSDSKCRLLPYHNSKQIPKASSSFENTSKINNNTNLSRKDFPLNFKFGVATSAYQIEGAALECGRGMSTWDSFSHIIRGNISDQSTGDVASNHYHEYKTDIQLMVDLGIDTYRFSLSWSRILPTGAGEINPEGVSFYNKLINELLQNGIEPYVTLYHWDMPLALENHPDVKGWRTGRIIKHFADYADTCFRLFGDRVKNWTTLNEAQSFAYLGYGTGTHAPGRCSSISGTLKSSYTGDSSTEPYICTHHALLSHAAAVKVYRTKYQAEQRGRIGITVNSTWYEPYTPTQEDIDAAQRCIEFELGWLLDPILLGDYPQSMRSGAGNRLPYFSEEEKTDLLGSVDFVGYNYYTAYYARSMPPVEPSKRWILTDRLAVTEYTDPSGELIGEPYGPLAFRWIYNCPWALPKMLEWMEQRYGKAQFDRTPIIITENGTMDMEFGLTLEEALNDTSRIRYLQDTLSHLATALRKNHYNVEGYFTWSLLDNFEWADGLQCRFGLHYVDYKDHHKRYPKTSALWYRSLLSDDTRLDSHRNRLDGTTSRPIKKQSRTCLAHLKYPIAHSLSSLVELLIPFTRRWSCAQEFILDYLKVK